MTVASKAKLSEGWERQRTGATALKRGGSRGGRVPPATATGHVGPPLLSVRIAAYFLGGELGVYCDVSSFFDRSQPTLPSQ